LRPESLKDFADRYFSEGSDLSLITTHMPPERNYGRIVRDASGQMQKIVESKNCTADQLRITEVNAGFYLLKLSLLQEAITSFSANEKTGEFYLTDVLAFALSKNKKCSSYFLRDASEALGINTQEEYALARKVLQTRINWRWMAEGVSMEDPNSTWIDEGVQLSPDVHLAMNVQIRGRSSVGPGVSIDSHSIVEGSRIHAGAKIEAFSLVKDSDLGSGTQVGPFARLRPGCVLDQNAKIGNFVEAKKSHFGKSSKANHLSYIGDSEVGEGANIGAGTITCNYDGYSKHSTKIGSRVFIGSNSSLVAPVEIGDDAMVGAGSVITKNIEAGALGLSRPEQTNISSGAQKFKAKRTTDTRTKG
jgi:bifunctional UDP-N-acetylglucosamine pyrophosphorylase / glucosamine-1-phosphate N-acetyltransferase